MNGTELGAFAPRRGAWMTRTSKLAAAVVVAVALAAVGHSADPAAVDSAAVDSAAGDPAAGDPAAADDAVESVVSLFELLVDGAGGDADTTRKCMAILAEKIQTRELSGAKLEKLRPRLDGILNKILAGKSDGPLYLDAALLAASWKNPAGMVAVRGVLASAKRDDAERRRALEALVAAGDATVLPMVAQVLADRDRVSPALRAATLAALGRLDDPRVAEVVLAAYDKLEADLKPKAVELLTQRPAWSKSLLEAIGKGRVPATALGANQVRKLLSSKDEELVKAVRAKWGSVRTERDPAREQVIAQVRQLLRKSPGDPRKGQVVFNRVCGQCHKIYGEGADVGPDITANGRSSFDQLLSNVFDPSLVIGASYQAVTVRTIDGRVLTGLPTEDSPQRLVLKVQGGKSETISRDEIDALTTSKLSLMPEDLEKQISAIDIADLFAFLTLDRPPTDAHAKRLPGAGQ